MLACVSVSVDSLAPLEMNISIPKAHKVHSLLSTSTAQTPTDNLMTISNTQHKIEDPFETSAPAPASIGMSATVPAKRFPVVDGPGFHPDSLLGRYHSTSFSSSHHIDLPAVNEALVKFQEMSVSNANMFPAFLDNSPSSNNLAALPRQSPPSMAQHQVNPQVNGGGGMNGMNGMNVGLPMNAGHQMDLNILFNQVEELSQLLRENREKTQAIIASAEELAVRRVCCCPAQSPAVLTLTPHHEGFTFGMSTDLHRPDSCCRLWNAAHFGASQQRDHGYGSFSSHTTYTYAKSKRVLLIFWFIYSRPTGRSPAPALGRQQHHRQTHARTARGRQTTQRLRSRSRPRHRAGPQLRLQPRARTPPRREALQRPLTGRA